MQPANEAYMRAYMQGYTDAYEKLRREERSPCIDLQGVMERYGVAEGRAREILKAVNCACNGGKIGLTTKVLLSELEYWESVVEKVEIKRLYEHREKKKRGLA